MLTRPGIAESGYLQGVWVQDVDLKTLMNMETAWDGKIMFSLAARHRTDGHYTVKIVRDRSAPQGKQVTLSLVKTYQGVETRIATVPAEHLIDAIQETRGFDNYREDFANVRFQVVTEGNTTVLRAKAWMSGWAEPSEWLVVGTDKEAGLQRPGQIGVEGYISRTSTDDMRILRIAQFEATAPGGLD